MMTMMTMMTIMKKKTMTMEMMLMRVSNLKLATEEGVLLHVHFVPGQGAIKP